MHHLEPLHCQGLHLVQADMKLRGAVEENTSITQEIAGMKVTLMKLQTERVKAGGRAAHEVDAALAKVMLQRQLLLGRESLYMLAPPHTHATLASKISAT